MPMCPHCQQVQHLTGNDFEMHLHLCRAVRGSAAQPQTQQPPQLKQTAPTGESRELCPVCNISYPRSLLQAHVDSHFQDNKNSSAAGVDHPLRAPIQPQPPKQQQQHQRSPPPEAPLPTKACPVCKQRIDITILDQHVSDHLDAGEMMRWESSGDGGGADQPLRVTPGAAAAAAAAANHSSTNNRQPAPPGSWICDVCGVALPVELRDQHRRAHERKHEVTAARNSQRQSSPDAATTTNNNNQRATTTSEAGVRIQCPFCRKVVDEIHFQEHLERHEQNNNSSDQSSNNNVANPDAAAAAAAAAANQKRDEPKKPCVICGQLVRESLLVWHTSSCGLEEPTVECRVCFDDVPLSECFSLSTCAHKMCRDCCERMFEIAARDGAFATCPVAECRQRVSSVDVTAFFGRDHAVAKRYAEFELKSTLSAGVYFHCKTTGCTNTVMVDEIARRHPTCFKCTQCMGTTCIACGEQPFHYRQGCAEAKANQALWLAVLREVSAKGEGGESMALEVRAKMLRYKELQDDEKWKAENCRVCTKCGTPINKLEGCDAMRCGEDAHGGNKQKGCGASLNWAQLKPYEPRLPRPPDAGRVHQELMSERQHSEFNPCAICRKVIKGPMFMCANCPQEITYCLQHVPEISKTIHRNHWFQVIS